MLMLMLMLLRTLSLSLSLSSSLSLTASLPSSLPLFLPQVLITPLGSLNVVVNAVCAWFILGETLDRWGWFGCALCIVGSSLVVVSAPEEQAMTSIEQVLDNVRHPAFLTCLAFDLIAILSLVVFVAPRCGNTNVMVYVAICSGVGAITVVSTKALGLALLITLDGHNQLSHGAFWLFVGTAAVSLTVQLNYLNRALIAFNTQRVTPIYFVLFTLATCILSGVLFQVRVSALQALAAACGFAIIIVGVWLLARQAWKGGDSSTNGNGGGKGGAKAGAAGGGRVGGDIDLDDETTSDEDEDGALGSEARPLVAGGSDNIAEL